jgi:hypothetical protein
MGIRNLMSDLAKPYEGYPFEALLMYGWAVVIGVFVFGVIIHSITKED